MRSGVRSRITSNPDRPGIWISRKTTSGRSESSASSTSAPSRHSPTTAKSGKAAINCLTPRRAAGSSSATMTVHSAFGNAGLQRKFVEGNAQCGRSTAIRVRLDHQRPPFAIQDSQAFASILNAVAMRHIVSSRQSGTVIRDREHQRVSVATRTDLNRARSWPACDAMPDRVLDQVLQGESRYGRLAKLLVYLHRHRQPVGEPGLFDRDVLSDEIQLLRERHLTGPMAAECTPEQVAELFHHRRGARTIAIARPYGNGIQRIEEEVWIELRLERRHPRVGQLLRHTRQLHLTLLGIRQIADGVSQYCDTG